MLIMPKRRSTRSRTRTVYKTVTRRAKGAMPSIGKILKGATAGLGAKEMTDIALDFTPLPETIQQPITLGVAVGTGYAVGGKWGAIGGALGGGIITALRYLRGGNGGGGGNFL